MYQFFFGLVGHRQWNWIVFVFSFFLAPSRQVDRRPIPLILTEQRYTITMLASASSLKRVNLTFLLDWLYRLEVASLNQTLLEWAAECRDTFTWTVTKGLFSLRCCRGVPSPSPLWPIRNSSSTGLLLLSLFFRYEQLSRCDAIQMFLSPIFSSGIFDDETCKEGTVNHGLVLVGYGTANGTSFWIARNSWGPRWGQNGYILMKRNVNMCRLADYAFLALP